MSDLTQPAILPPHASTTRMTGAGITTLITAWLVWVALVLSYPLDFIIAWFGWSNLPQVDQAPREFSQEFVLAFVGLSILQLGLVFLFRWFFLRYLVQPRRLLPGNWPASLVALLGVVLILALIKAIEVYGLIIWFGSNNWTYYMSFFVVSFLIILTHMPCFLLTRRVIHRHLPVDRV